MKRGRRREKKWCWNWSWKILFARCISSKHDDDKDDNIIWIFFFFSRNLKKKKKGNENKIKKDERRALIVCTLYLIKCDKWFSNFLYLASFFLLIFVAHNATFTALFILSIMIMIHHKMSTYYGWTWGWHQKAMLYTASGYLLVWNEFLNFTQKWLFKHIQKITKPEPFNGLCFLFLFKVDKNGKIHAQF